VAVAQRHPQQLVLGADQLLECEGQWFDKPGSWPQAREQLLRLSGRSHRLATAAVLVRGEIGSWAGGQAPALGVRSLSSDFIGTYLDAVGERALSSVGAYQIEGLGVQLIDSFSGD